MPNDYVDRRKLMQRLNDRSLPLSWKQDVDSISWMILLALCLIFLIVIALKSCEVTPQPAIIKKPRLEFQDMKCGYCHSVQKQVEKLTQYFKENGSPVPREMSNAVLKTKQPRLLAAIAVIESNGNPSIRRSGYKHRHHGAFQVNPRHWGKVPKDAKGQAKQADRILEELLATEAAIIPALNFYGGEKDKEEGQYAFNVLNELTKVP